MDLEQAKQTFFEESHELLADMESILLNVEPDQINREQLDALFRTMHTIKGSAGLFGLEEIIHFTHQVENVLDQLREGKLSLNDLLIGLLLRSHDQVQLMLSAVAQQQSLSALNSTELLEELNNYVQSYNGASSIAEPVAPISTIASESVEPVEIVEPNAEESSCSYLLSLRFNPDVLRNGMDPASFIRYLAGLGTIQHICTITANLPLDASFDPENHYLGFELVLHTSNSEQILFEAFEFVREGSRIHIWPLAQALTHWAEATQMASTAEVAEIVLAWQSFGLEVSAAGSLADADATPISAPVQEDTPAPLSPVNTLPAPGTPVTHLEEKPLAKPAESRFIKVEANKLDHLINLIGELVISGATTQLLAKQSSHSNLSESTQTLTELIEKIRSSTLAMRMVQVGEIFNRFPRVVRDVSRELGKEIELHIEGAETELDKAMVDKLGDPLMHLVRNAMDHGIETTEQRLAKGKSACGHLWLTAYQESGSMVIEISDDGGGLNVERILAKAVERGLLTPDARLSEQETFQLIFAPGFSTAEKVSQLSGRGVGMDVVKQSITQLHGALDIDSVLDVGTTFRLRLPLTLAIIDGFLVQVGQSTFVLPLANVIECIELATPNHASNLHDSLNLRGELLPLLHLDHFLELPSVAVKRQNVVVVRHGERKAGLVVNALLGEFQTVIKPLGSLFQQLKAISGSTILGTGEVALILDTSALIQSACLKESHFFTQTASHYRVSTSHTSSS